MRDYAQYASRIPSPARRATGTGSQYAPYGGRTSYASPIDRNTTATTTRNVTRHPLGSAANEDRGNSNGNSNSLETAMNVVAAMNGGKHLVPGTNNSTGTASTSASSAAPSISPPTGSPSRTHSVSRYGGATPSSSRTSGYATRRNLTSNNRNASARNVPETSTGTRNDNDAGNGTGNRPAPAAAHTTPTDNRNAGDNRRSFGNYYLNRTGSGRSYNANRGHGYNTNSNSNSNNASAAASHTGTAPANLRSPSPSSQLLNHDNRHHSTPVDPPSVNVNAATAVPANSPARSASSSSAAGNRYAPPSANNAISTTSAVPAPTTALSASDALALRRDGTEATVSKLRAALDEAQSKDNTAKAALAKSDAVILELRTSVRQLKQQLEQAQDERQEYKQKQDSLSKQLVHQRALTKQSNTVRMQELEDTIQSLRSQIALHESQANNEKVGELQVQLDRAHAQILTADMVRKELEDTLEAEQYTWELRVQDQERTIQQLQQECRQLKDDLETCRAQWKEAEEGWNGQVSDLESQLRQARTRLATTAASQTQSNNDREELMQKIDSLEHERSELQNCLDEALKELEAVDVELQNDGKKALDASSIVALQDLLRWVVREHCNDADDAQFRLDQPSEDPSELLEQLQKGLELAFSESKEESAGQQQKLAQLRDQVEMHKKELKNREESSAELRESLKEAVGLLKPLQDAMAKAENDKTDLEEQVKQLQQDQHANVLERRRREVRLSELEEQLESLQQQLTESRQLAEAREKLLESSSPGRIAPNGESEDSMSNIKRARDELRRKRETENNLQQLLRDAQSRFSTMHQQNQDMASKNRELQGRLESSHPEHDGHDDVEMQIEQYRQQVTEREREIENLKQHLTKLEGGDSSRQQVEALETQLQQSQEQLKKKEHSEKVLNKSLKEALGLLKPLQMHLEEAEREKLTLSKELRTLRKNLRRLQKRGDSADDQSRSTLGQQGLASEFQKMRDEMEDTIRQLELENSQLHDQIEDMTRSDAGTHNSSRTESRLRQKFIELTSRYEVTQNKLEDANVENLSLTKALRRREQEDKARVAEFEQMKEKLERTESELQNAKAIARSALAKAEELTMANIESMSITGGPVDMKVSPIK